MTIPIIEDVLPIMTAPLLTSLASAPIVLQVAAPGFCTGKPDVRFEQLIPSERHAILLDRWTTPVVPRMVNFHVLRQVYVAGEGLVFDQDLKLVAESVTQNESPHVAAAFEAVRTAHASGTYTYRPGVSLLCGKMGLSNYGHWLLEMLPMAYLTREWIAKGWSVFLPIIYPWMDDVVYGSLGMIGIGRASCFGNDGAPCFFDELVFVSGLSQVGHYYPSVAVDCMGSMAAAVPAGVAERIWVSRLDPAGRHRALANEEEVCAALAARGWHILRPGAMTLREQIVASKGALHMAGVAGAGLTNIGFMRPGGRVTTFMPAPTPDVFFLQLATHRGLAYREVRCPLTPGQEGAMGLSGQLVMSVDEVLAQLA